MVPLYDVITTLRRDGKRIPAGDSVTMDAGEAQPLLAKRAIATSKVRPVPAAPAAKAVPPQKPAGGTKGKPKPVPDPQTSSTAATVPAGASESA